MFHTLQSIFHDKRGYKMKKKFYHRCMSGGLIHTTLRIVLAMFLVHCLVSNVLAAGKKTQQEVAAKPLYNDLFAVSFPTEKDGWACGRWGTIVHTSDGGVTWEFQTSGTDYTLSDIQFTDPMNGWAVGDQGTIVHTADGGKTWVQQKSPVTDWLMSAQFANSKKGWISGERMQILYTEDGGNNWKVQFKDKDYIFKRMSFCDEKNGWAVGEYGFIYHTADGGKTWQSQAGGFEIPLDQMEIVSGVYLFSVAAVNPQTAWVVGIEGTVMKTQDGGKTWPSVTNDKIPKQHLFSVYADKQGTVIITGNDLLLVSADGGKKFTTPKLEPKTTYGYLYKVAPRKGAGFVAVGVQGWIYVSDPKGTVWKRAVY